MATVTRSRDTLHCDVDLCCVQCEGLLGTFQNEWIRLTTTYARPKYWGFDLGGDLGTQTRKVPSGPAQRSLEGCDLVEVSCKRCKNTVGQYCISAPDVEKRPLVHQYFYRFSKTFLQNRRSRERVEPVFGYGGEIARPLSPKPWMPTQPSMTPTSRWANTPLRQSSRTPAISSNATVPVRSGSHDTQILQPEFLDERRERPSIDIGKLQQEMSLQRSMLQEHSVRIDTQTARLDVQQARVDEQQTSLRENEDCSSAQASRIVEQDRMIKNQAKQLEAQQRHLTTITNQLSKLQRTLDGLRATLVESRTDSPVKDSGNHSQGNTTNSMKMDQRNTKEIDAFREQTQAWKSKSSAITSEVGGTVGASIDRVLSRTSSIAGAAVPTLSTVQTLRKRKRTDTNQPSPEEPETSTGQHEKRVSLLGTYRQMPTPQASDGGQKSPVQSPPSATVSIGKSRKIGEPDQLKTKPHLVTSSHISETSQNTAPEIYNVETESLIPDVSNGSTQRVTRARAKATQPTEMIITGQSQSNTNGAHSPSHPILSMDVDEETQSADHDTASDTSYQPSPVAASISSEGLPQLVDIDLALAHSATTGQEVVVAPTNAIPSEQVSTADPRRLPDQPPIALDRISNVHKLNSNVSDGGVLNSLDEQTFNDTQLDCVQDPDVDYHFDSGSDIPLSQPELSLHRSGSEDLDTMSLSEWTNVGLLNGRKSDDTQIHVNSTVQRENRSLAPEPRQFKRAGPRAGIRFDAALTPELFSQSQGPSSLPTGRLPKLVKPSRLRAHQIELNYELERLGLSEWIDKDKRSKEYREAVFTAREAYRSRHKAEYYRSVGLENVSSGLSVSQSTSPPSYTEHVPRSAPLSTIENAPGPTTKVPDDTEGYESGANNIEVNTESAKQAPRTRQSEGRRRSGRKSGVSADTEHDPTTDGDSGTNEPISQQQKLAGRTRRSLRTSVLPDCPAEADVDGTFPEQATDKVNGTTSIHEDSARTAAAMVSWATETRSISVKPSLPPASNTEGEAHAKSRKDAILLRDQMAKELMEREDMGM